MCISISALYTDFNYFSQSCCVDSMAAVLSTVPGTFSIYTITIIPIMSINLSFIIGKLANSLRE